MWRPVRKNSSTPAMPNPLSKTTPFPNYLIDEVMPKVRDTEWRLVCVIVRQTLGWSDGTGRRKEQDWLTHAQLKRRMNRAAAAVSQAVDRLVSLGLIEVRNEAGDALSTAARRRREPGRLYFRLHPRLIQAWEGPRSLSSPESSVSEVRKAKTTKENGTKVKETPLLTSESEDGGSSSSRPEHTGRIPPADQAAIDAFVLEFSRLYSSQFACQPPPVSGGDLMLLHEKLGSIGGAQLIRGLPQFFGSELSFAVRQRHSLESFLHSTMMLKLLPERREARAGE